MAQRLVDSAVHRADRDNATLYRLLSTQLRDVNVPESVVDAIPPLLIFLITWICMRLRKQTLGQVGLQFDRRWLAQLLLGTALGIAWLLAVAIPIWIAGGVEFSVNPNASMNILLIGLWGFALGALMEELLHRGFIFQRLIDGIGFIGAQFLVAAIFAFGHLENPEMEGWVQLRACTDLAIASLIFGLAYWRTKSLALPFGLHLGWNWMQGSVMGVAVSGHETQGLLVAHITDAPVWLSGGGFGLEASLVSQLVSLLVLAALWYWPKKSSPSQAQPALA
ncbi:CPBP family intramembrane glutamic endopeptidase [Simiduia agarivorans]|uniref:Abortive infection protein n=1 Tax=Simiduia agarivorans (strain DSM 21679 / JCM 13881 / BCRC 17597 / SA1) TaxID=1117647 RepID=K4KLX0_SIMAS|nr:CPBP family intramembrane glutamic endopeptidase [Simiduia agarivorans]AFV00037.1 abortive infection protein [Simiduia agarivorans SA1 = DSM 21679]